MSDYEDWPLAHHQPGQCAASLEDHGSIALSSPLQPGSDAGEAPAELAATGALPICTAT